MCVLCQGFSDSNFTDGFSKEKQKESLSKSVCREETEAVEAREK